MNPPPNFEKDAEIFLTRSQVERLVADRGEMDLAMGWEKRVCVDTLYSVFQWWVSRGSTTKFRERTTMVAFMEGLKKYWLKYISLEPLEVTKEDVFCHHYRKVNSYDETLTWVVVPGLHRKDVIHMKGAWGPLRAARLGLSKRPVATNTKEFDAVLRNSASNLGYLLEYPEPSRGFELSQRSSSNLSNLSSSIDNSQEQARSLFQLSRRLYEEENARDEFPRRIYDAGEDDEDEEEQDRNAREYDAKTKKRRKDSGAHFVDEQAEVAEEEEMEISSELSLESDDE
jgi:hypothetical protein